MGVGGSNPSVRISNFDSPLKQGVSGCNSRLDPQTDLILHSMQVLNDVNDWFDYSSFRKNEQFRI